VKHKGGPIPMEKEAQDMVGLVAKSTWECLPPLLGFTHHKA